jgi:hypothetical protein
MVTLDRCNKFDLQLVENVPTAVAVNSTDVLSKRMWQCASHATGILGDVLDLCVTPSDGGCKHQQEEFEEHESAPLVEKLGHIATVNVKRAEARVHDLGHCCTRLGRKLGQKTLSHDTLHSVRGPSNEVRLNACKPASESSDLSSSRASWKNRWLYVHGCSRISLTMLSMLRSVLFEARGRVTWVTSVLFTSGAV